jgi:hypothetical protein
MAFVLHVQTAFKADDAYLVAAMTGNSGVRHSPVRPRWRRRYGVVLL